MVLRVAKNLVRNEFSRGDVKVSSGELTLRASGWEIVNLSQRGMEHEVIVVIGAFGTASGPCRYEYIPGANI